MQLILKHSIRIPILFLAAIVAVGCVFNAGTTLAWFAFAGGESVTLPAGKVSYRPNGAAAEGDTTSYGAFIPDTKEEDGNSYIFPGKELVAEPLKLRNLSTIDTNVRVRITGVIRKNPEGGGEQLFLSEGRTENGAYQLGMTSSPEDGSLFIPLLEILFYSDAGTGYEWKSAAVPLAPEAVEWELLPVVDTEGNRVLPASVSGGDLYTVITSAAVVTSLDTEKEENIFTDIYANKKLTLTVEYLAKQHDAMEWSVFYKDVFNE